jgi:CHASE1-domain containing sensor protein
MKIPVSLLTLAVVLLAGSLSVSQAQQRMRMTAEQRAARLKDSLALNDDQVGKIVTIFQESDKQRQDAFASAGDDRDARMAAMRKVMDAADARIDSILTGTQKAKYEEMKKQRAQNFPMRPRND